MNLYSYHKLYLYIYIYQSSWLGTNAGLYANTWTYLDGEKQQEGICLMKMCVYLVSNSSHFCSFVYIFFHPLLDIAAHGSPL